MMLENVNLDFRCQSCGMIKRVDAMLACSVVSHLPSDWAVADGGTVVCPVCITAAEPAVHEVNEANRVAETMPQIQAAVQAALNEEAFSNWRLDNDGPMPLTYPAEYERRKRADEAREKVSALHAGRDEENPFEGRKKGESLDPPTTVAPVPAYGETCGDCGKKISEAEGWRPDPKSTHFIRVHTSCFRDRSKE